MWATRRCRNLGPLSLSLGKRPGSSSLADVLIFVGIALVDESAVRTLTHRRLPPAGPRQA
jgi:hypothetical protein